jgi:adenine phosphoribosyltransferase
MTTEFLKGKIRHVPDFPKPGILFYDITTLLRDPEGLKVALDAMAAPFADHRVDLVVGMESRGFIFGAALADRLGAGFVPVRKPGKLPAQSVRVSYDLEYGSDALEIHADAITAGQRVLIVDDLLATGGTARATIDLVGGLGADIVACAFLVELTFLGGREKLGDTPVHAVLPYDD